jgi:hypothetical protein
MILCCFFYIASAVPPSVKAYRAMPTLMCGINLIVVNERRRVVRGYAFNKIA